MGIVQISILFAILIIIFPTVLDVDALRIDVTVISHQKISDTQGGFTGTLDNLDKFGNSVAAIGDLDNDGIEDIAVGAFDDDDGGLNNRGAVWILFLNADGTVKSQQKISDTQGGFLGVLDAGDQFGTSVAGIGDLDNDGIEDIAVGANRDDDGGTDRGAVWILFLNTDGTVKSHQKISDTQGGFIGILDDGDQFGISVAAIGDLDNDGIEDIAVGAFLDDDGGSGRGAVWVLFLNTDGTVSSHQKISDTQGGFTGILDTLDLFGVSVAGIGDLNNDGIEDIAVGAQNDSDGGSVRGAVWVLFLNTDGTVSSHQKISDTQGGFTGTLDNFDKFGNSVAAIGDLNNDTIEDIAVGAFQDDDGGLSHGAVWILFLNTDGTVSSHQKISDTRGGFTGTLDDGDLFGVSVATIGDLNNDGIEDIAVGAFLDDDGDNGRGAVWVLFLNTKTCSSCADFNGDGFDDLAVGVMLEDLSGTNEGAVNVIFGSTSGLHKNLGRGDQFFHQDSLKIEDVAETGDQFSGVLAVGDFNDDGFDDLAIGVPGENAAVADIGGVNVIYGSAKALHKGLGHIDQFWTQDSLKIEDTAELSDNFGRALTVGDFNDDGFDDLAIGVPFEDVGGNSEGAVNVIYGSAKALHKGLGHADQFYHQDSLKIEDVAEIGDRFGSALAAGDFNDDGFDDLAIGVPGEDNFAGGVNVIYGSFKGVHKGFSGQADQFWTQDTFKIEGAAGSFDQFGSALAAGDFNNDGFDDLAIGVPGEDLTGTNNEGAVNVIYGSPKGLHKGLGLPDQLWTQDSPGIEDTAELFDNFGGVLAVGDFNDDGFDDLAIGVENEDLAGFDEGAVNVIYGSASGLHENLGLPDQFWTQDSTAIADVAENDDKFGHALTVGDFNADGFDDLAIGVPSEFLAVDDQGAVNVIYGSASGLHRNLGLPDQFWSQDAPGIVDTGELFDCFGLSLPGSPFDSTCSD